MVPDTTSRVKRDSRKEDVAKQERWAISTNKALSCKLQNTQRAIDTAREYQCKVFDIETKYIKRKWKAVINRKVELMFAEGFIPPGDVKLRCAPTQKEKLIYQSDEYAMGDPLYRPALYKIVGSLPSSEHQLLREYARERVWRPQTAGPRLGDQQSRVGSGAPASSTSFPPAHTASSSRPPSSARRYIRPSTSRVPRMSRPMSSMSSKPIQRVTSARA